MKIDILGFAGEMPRAIPRLLGNSYAQSAVNTKLEDGSLTPIRRGRLEHELEEPAQTIYRFRDEWLSWPVPVNVAAAPVAEDRLYVTGDGKPKLYAGDEIFDLEVPRPILAVNTAISVDDETIMVDGTAIIPKDGESGTTTSGYSYTVSEANRAATITLTRPGTTESEAEALVNSIGYANTTVERTPGVRTFTLKEVVDNGDDRNTTVLNIQSKVFVDSDETGTPGDAVEIEYTEDDEYVTIDGATFKPVDGLSVNTNSGLTVTVAMEYSTANVTITAPAGMPAVTAQNVINSVGYSNQHPFPTPGVRTFRIFSVKDNGADNNISYSTFESRVYLGVDNPSSPTTSTPLTPVDTPAENDPPIGSVGSKHPSYTAGDGVVTVFQGALVDTVDPDQLITEIVMTVAGFRNDFANDPPILVSRPLNPTYDTGTVTMFADTKVAVVDTAQTVDSITFEVSNLVNGSVSADFAQTILYAYTWVTKFDEESEPADLSAELLWDEGLTVTLTGFASPPFTRGVDRMRIYRSQTSSLGVTDLFLIAEREATTAPFIDDSLTINEPIPSTNYNPPPDGMSGIISLPNGMLAAFQGKRLYFCEPFIPHAWPEAYVLTTDYPIVGLGAFGSSVAVMTTGLPYVVSGTAPENMVMERIETNYPCLNARGIADLGYAIVYPSHGGLVSISGSGVNIVSGSLFTRDQWLELNPKSFVAAQFSGRYMASYDYFDIDNIRRRGIIIMDLSGEQPFLIRSSDFADAMTYQIETGALYMVKNGTKIYQWDAQSQPYGEQTWLSKRFVLRTNTNFGAILIEGEDITSVAQKVTIDLRNDRIRKLNRELIAAGSIGGEMGAQPLGMLPLGGSLLDPVESDAAAIGVTIIADGKEVAYVNRINEICRLPSGFLARSWEILVRGNIQVTGIVLANTPTEIAEGA